MRKRKLRSESDYALSNPIPLNDYLNEDEEDEAELPRFTDSELTVRRQELFASGSDYLPAKKENIVGINDVLNQIDDVIHWLRYSTEYQKYNARLEPGILFEGEPGTGKTLVSRYIATESNALFINVRDFPHNGSYMKDNDISTLFQMARETYIATDKPVVLFWDEFEGNARERSKTGIEENASVSQLTAELDGVHGKNEGVLLIGCTNYSYMIDAALLRAGRMGLHIEFNAPDRYGKMMLLDYYLGRISTDGNIDSDTLSHFFEDFATASTIEEAVHEAWRFAVKRYITEQTSAPSLSEKDLVEVFLNRMIGPAPTFSTLSEQNRLYVAVHEVGHAIAAYVYGIPIRLITVRPGKQTNGRLITASLSHRTGTIEEQINHLRVGHGGIVAEIVAGIPRGVGNSSDTENITNIARMLVDQQGYGANINGFNPQGIDPRAQFLTMSDYLLERLDMDIEKLINQTRADVMTTLRLVNRDRLIKIAEIVIEKETLTGIEFNAIAKSILDDPEQYRDMGI